MPIWDDTKLPKLALFDVKDTVRLSSKQIILSRATWCHLGELRYVTSTLHLCKGFYSTYKLKERVDNLTRSFDLVLRTD